MTVNGAASGLQFGANTGSFEVTGATSLTNIAGNGIDASNATGTYKFDGSTTIGFTGAGRAINLIKSDVMFTTGGLAITGNGTAGSIGIDLSGSTNPNGVNASTANILLATGAGQTATINNVGTGVLLGDATNGSAGAYMKYGNQTPTSSGGSGSQINVIAGGTTIDTTHLTSTSGFVEGRYEFTGVSFTGSASFEASPNFFFVAANALGTGDGSSAANRANAATLVTDLNGNLLANKTIVLINDGNTITLSGTANLDANTNIDGFGNGNSVAAFTVPVNVIIDAFTGAVTDPTGHGAATLTTASGHNLINLNGGNSIKNVTLSGGDFVIAGTSTNLTVQGTTITSGALGVFSFTNTSGTTSITNNTISGGGSLLTVNGGTAGITLSALIGSISNTAGSGISIKNTTGGSVALDHLNVSGATATPLTFDNNKATFAITNSVFAVNPGVTLLNVDTGTGGSTTTLNFSTDTLTQTSGEIAIIGAGARNIDLSGQNFTNSGTTAANVISSTGQTGGTISFGDVAITSYSNAGRHGGEPAGHRRDGGVQVDLDVTTTGRSGPEHRLHSLRSWFFFHDQYDGWHGGDDERHDPERRHGDLCQRERGGDREPSRDQPDEHRRHDGLYPSDGQYQRHRDGRGDRPEQGGHDEHPRRHDQWNDQQWHREHKYDADGDGPDDRRDERAVGQRHYRRRTTIPRRGRST